MQGRPKPVYLRRLEREAAGIDRELFSVIKALSLMQAPWPLLLTGPAGTGKTCASLWLLDHTRGGKYFTITELTEALIELMKGELRHEVPGQGSFKVHRKSFWRDIEAAPLVVLDELGCRDKVSDHHYEAVKRLLDLRHGLPFIVISNLELDAISRLYDDRVASRLAGGTVVSLKGEDRRLRRD